MITFVCFEAIVIVHYALILKQTLQPNNNWYTWICLGKYLYIEDEINLVLIIIIFCVDIVAIGIVIDLSSGVLGVFCMLNFGRGLKSYVQRGRTKKTRQDLEMNKANSNWQIDED